MKKNYSTPHTRTTAIRTLRLMNGSPQGNATTTNSNATIQLSEPRGNGDAANAASRGSSIWED